MKLFSTIVIISLLCVFTSTSLLAEDAITPKGECIRMMVATGRRFIAQTPMPQTDKTEALAMVMEKEKEKRKRKSSKSTEKIAALNFKIAFCDINHRILMLNVQRKL